MLASAKYFKKLIIYLFSRARDKISENVETGFEGNGWDVLRSI